MWFHDVRRSVTLFLTFWNLEVQNRTRSSNNNAHYLTVLSAILPLQAEFKDQVLHFN